MGFVSFVLFQTSSRHCYPHAAASVVYWRPCSNSPTVCLKMATISQGWGYKSSPSLCLGLSPPPHLKDSPPELFTLLQFHTAIVSRFLKTADATLICPSTTQIEILSAICGVFLKIKCFYYNNLTRHVEFLFRTRTK